MRFFVDTHSGVPIYSQISRQIEKGVAGGILKPGERLPAVREVALALSINPNTVARAYRELEARGTITSVQGRGTFVAEDQHALLDRREIMRARIREMLLEGAQLNLTKDEIREVFEHELELWEEGGDE